MKLVTFALVGCAVNALFADPARQLIRVSAPPQNPAVEQPHQQNAGHVALQEIRSRTISNHRRTLLPTTRSEAMTATHQWIPKTESKWRYSPISRNVPGRSAGMDNSGTAQCPRAIPERTHLKEHAR